MLQRWVCVDAANRWAAAEDERDRAATLLLLRDLLIAWASQLGQAWSASDRTNGGRGLRTVEIEIHGYMPLGVAIKMKIENGARAGYGRRKVFDKCA